MMSFCYFWIFFLLLEEINGFDYSNSIKISVMFRRCGNERFLNFKRSQTLHDIESHMKCASKCVLSAEGKCLGIEYHADSKECYLTYELVEGISELTHNIVTMVPYELAEKSIDPPTTPPAHETTKYFAVKTHELSPTSPPLSTQPQTQPPTTAEIAEDNGGPYYFGTVNCQGHLGDCPLPTLQNIAGSTATLVKIIGADPVYGCSKNYATFAFMCPGDATRHQFLSNVGSITYVAYAKCVDTKWVTSNYNTEVSDPTIQFQC